MGKRNSQRKNTVMVVDSDDEIDRMLVSRVDGEVDVDQDSYLLDRALDALDEKRGSTREKALSSIIETLKNNMQHEFVEKNFATLLHQCLSAIKGSKKASANEIALASHAVGVLALTVGCNNSNTRDIYEKSVRLLDESLTTSGSSDAPKISSLAQCLAIITFVGGTNEEETEKSMDMMWQLNNPKLDSNEVSFKPLPSLITAVVSAWSFLLSTMSYLELNSKSWQNTITYLSSLLDQEDRSIRIAAGEALALIFEVGVTEEFPFELKEKVINRVKNLAAEAYGKGSTKKDLNTQRELFRDISDFFEHDTSPEITIKIGKHSLQTSSWCQRIKLNFFKHFLGDGFIKQMQENEFLREIFDFTVKEDEEPVFYLKKKTKTRVSKTLNKHW